MKKYYLEFTDMNSDEAYCMQTKWFDTEQQAIEFYAKFTKDFDYINLTIDLMSSEWNEYEDTYTDIELERRLR